MSIEPLDGGTWMTRVESDHYYASLQVAMARAVLIDHPCRDYAGCDVARANAEGYTYAAAHLLMGATETPALSLLLQVFPGAYDSLLRRSDGWPVGWDEWVTFHEAYGRPCPECGHVMYGDDETMPTQCGNCLAAIPTPGTDS